MPHGSIPHIAHEIVAAACYGCWHASKQVGHVGLKQSIARISQSAFQINANYEPAARTLRTEVLGTAFAVHDDGYLVTAKHVVDAISAMSQVKNKLSARVAFAGPPVDTPEIQMRANFSATGFQVVSVDEDNDLALLRTNLDFFRNTSWADQPPRPVRSVRLHAERPEEGEPVACSGYPLSQPSLITTQGIIASAWASDPTAQRGIVDRYLADMTANPGNSGGPVYRYGDGRVIGVCVAGLLAPIRESPGLAARRYHDRRTCQGGSRPVDKGGRRGLSSRRRMAA